MLKGVPAFNKALLAAQLKAFKEADERSKRVALDAQNYAKDNRVWTDQTGDARRSITGTAASKTAKIIVYLAIGVDYGVYLEESNGGAYAIIQPTIDQFRATYLERYRNIL